MKRIFISVLVLMVAMFSLIFLLSKIGIVHFERASFENLNEYPLTTDSTIVLLTKYTNRPSSINTKLYFINFWSIGCGHCISEMKDLNELKKSFENKDRIRFLAATGDDSIQAEERLKKSRINFEFEKYYIKGFRSQLKQICQKQHILVDSIDMLPCFFIIDNNGAVLKYIEGEITGNCVSVKPYLDSLLALPQYR